MGVSMAHDQNCPARDNDTLPDSLLAWEPSCQCELIDKVRADTVEQIWLASKERQAAKRGES